jgi:hypothetical protein
VLLARLHLQRDPSSEILSARSCSSIPLSWKDVDQTHGCVSGRPASRCPGAMRCGWMYSRAWREEATLKLADASSRCKEEKGWPPACARDMNVSQGGWEEKEKQNSLPDEQYMGSPFLDYRGSRAAEICPSAISCTAIDNLPPPLQQCGTAIV